jgi:hypothetical protein
MGGTQMRVSAWLKIGILVLAALGGNGFALAAEPVQGSFWYAIDNITSIEEGAEVLVWVTLPPAWHGQEVDVTSIDPAPVQVTVDEQSGNKVIEWVWRPQPWEMLPEMEPGHFFFHFDFTLEEKPVRFSFDPALVESYDRDSDLFRQYTAADTWLQTDGPVRDMAQQIVGQETNPGQQALVLYHWIMENLTFVPGGEGQRDAASVLAGRRGDCGQFSNLYTAMCRSVGIPARNVSLAWMDGGLHDISEIFLPGYGWFPVDTSLGQMLLPGGAGMSPDEVADFMAPRNVPLGDADFVFGNLPDARMAISQGVNVRFDSPTAGKQVILQRMRPGGDRAHPAGFQIEGFNSSLVHGGFFVFGEEVADEEAAHMLTHQRLASSFFSEGLYDVVEDGCLRNLEKYNDSVNSWINLGKVYMHKGEYYKAEAAFKRAIQGTVLSRKDKAQALIWAHNYLGNCYDMLGQREMAEAEYQQVTDLGDNFRGAVDYARKYLDRPFRKAAPGQ